MGQGSEKETDTSHKGLGTFERSPEELEKEIMEESHHVLLGPLLICIKLT